MKIKSINILVVCFLSLFAMSCSKERVKIDTEFGSMIVELREDTPLHRENFLKLAGEGYYNDLLFHRVMGGFMVQGGDPDSRTAKPGQTLGVGGPGYTIPAEFTGGLHIKGAIAAARMGDAGNPGKESSGSQFYIVHGTPIDANNIDGQLQRNRLKKYTEADRQAYLDAGAGAAFLDDNYTVFGQVVEGFDVIDKIAAQQVAGANRPVKDIKMQVSLVR